ncbi:MAG TPA: L-aspartate oxidase [Acidimicrobiales bacterium]|nr:L-aspartate oxidase [Acidimicrobiales bacterium]
MTPPGDPAPGPTSTPVPVPAAPDAPDAPGPFDVLVLGSGVAGLSAAVRLAGTGYVGRPGAGLHVGVLTKGELTQSATRWAQGGVAAVLGGDEDSTDLHLADTLAAGAGLCDADAVRVLVDEGPARVRELIALGAEFDREASGLLALAREGGHSRPRVVHAGGAATGAEVERALVAATRAAAGAVLERWFALDLLVEDGRCRGVLALRPDGRPVAVLADQVVLATGGVGQLFAVTTNPREATGDGVAMALRAGVPVADVEFVQFHPTALHHPAMPRPLLSEALRGHGALLRDASGERFVDELAPRDVVSRAMASRMAAQGADHLWLDATGLAQFDKRFPTIAASLASIGLDPAVDWLPIAPAAHHLSGGVVTDLHGATALPGLWAAGEAACTGVHGANRLASNSLLEGMVFGARLAEAIAGGRSGPEPTGVMQAILGCSPPALPAGVDDVGPIGVRPAPPTSWPRLARPAGPALVGTAAVAATAVAVAAAEPAGGGAAGSGSDPADLGKLRDRLQRAMTAGAGVVRSQPSLDGAGTTVAEVAGLLAGATPSVETGELANLATVAAALLGSARLREESRGAHTRVEYPAADPAWRLRLVHGLGNGGLGDGGSGNHGLADSGARR